MRNQRRIHELKKKREGALTDQLFSFILTIFNHGYVVRETATQSALAVGII